MRKKLTMSLKNLFRNGRPRPLPPRVRALVSSVLTYLKNRPMEDEVVPKFVAKALNESEVSVMTVFRFLQEEGVAQQWFGVFCGRTDVPLARFSRVDEIPGEFECNVCDEQHCISENTCKAEVFYTVNREKLNQFDLAAAA
jgi:hypothetical protein